MSAIKIRIRRGKGPVFTAEAKGDYLETLAVMGRILAGVAEDCAHDGQWLAVETNFRDTGAPALHIQFTTRPDSLQTVREYAFFHLEETSADLARLRTTPAATPPLISALWTEAAATETMPERAAR